MSSRPQNTALLAQPHRQLMSIPQECRDIIWEFVRLQNQEFNILAEISADGSRLGYRSLSPPTVLLLLCGNSRDFALRRYKSLPSLDGRRIVRFYPPTDLIYLQNPERLLSFPPALQPNPWTGLESIQQLRVKFRGDFNEQTEIRLDDLLRELSSNSSVQIWVHRES